MAAELLRLKGELLQIRGQMIRRFKNASRKL